MTIRASIDGIDIEVPPGTLVIRAAEQLGIAIPRFCDHPLLAPAGACRQCLVDVQGQRKPLASCTTTVTEGMVVRTQLTSEVAAAAQASVMEMLLINHPLDCPTCDKGGECPLQNQAMTAGRPVSRFPYEDKRHFRKPVALSAEILLDRERCVLCARCTRFSAEIAGDPFIAMQDRGALQQVGVGGEPLDSYFSGNTVQICPVGALTDTTYRFRSRPFDLSSTDTTCEHCAAGCALRVDHRRSVVLRRLAGEDPDVNEEWSCDKGRWAFRSTVLADRLTVPQIRDTHGALREASWPEAIAAAAAGLSGQRTGVLAGGRGTVEDLYAYAEFARRALGTGDIDFRCRPHSAQEQWFLATRVAGSRLTYGDLAAAPQVLLVAFEPEDEAPIAALRLRGAVRAGTTTVTTLAPFASRGSVNLHARVLACRPGEEPRLLASPEVIEAMSVTGAVVLVGERAAVLPGTLTAVAQLADRTGAAVAWVPRRAGERGGVEAGALPGPGGRDTAAMLAAVADGQLHALVCGAIDVADLPDPQAARDALDAARFVVSLEVRASAVTERADVVLPVAAAAEKHGTFYDWEGRPRRVQAALEVPGALPDARVLAFLARALGTDLGFTDTDGAAAHRRTAGPSGGSAPAATLAAPAPPAPVVPAAPECGPGRAVLATWRLLLDLGRGQDGADDLAATARPAVARMSAATAEENRIADGAPVTVSTPRGRITLPLRVTEMPDRLVWIPQHSPHSRVNETLAAAAGAVVDVAAEGAPR